MKVLSLNLADLIFQEYPSAQDRNLLSSALPFDR